MRMLRSKDAQDLGSDNFVNIDYLGIASPLENAWIVEYTSPSCLEAIITLNE